MLFVLHGRHGIAYTVERCRVDKTISILDLCSTCVFGKIITSSFDSFLAVCCIQHLGLLITNVLVQ